MLPALVLLAGCRPEPNDARPATGDLAAAADVVFEAGDSGPPPYTLDSGIGQDACAGRVLDADADETIALDLPGDFDFDSNGLLVAWNGNHIVGYDPDGDGHRIAPNVALGGAGLRSLPSGDLLVAVPDSGVLRMVDYDTGASSTVVGGLSRPTGLEIGQDGTAYASEEIEQGSVRRFDPYTGDNAFVAQLSFPSALALSPDEGILYVVARIEGQSTIVAVDRPGEDEWSPVLREIWRAPREIASITTDVCGHLYVVERSGEVLRIRADGEGIEPLTRLGGTTPDLGAARFGNDLGGFGADRLYVAGRSRVHVLDIGVSGRQVLSAQR